MESFINIAIWVAFALVLIAIIAAVVLPLINSLSNPKSLLKSGIGVVVIVVVFLIGWAISGNEVTARYASNGINATSSQLVGGALVTMYILFVVAVIGVVFSEINKALK